MRMMTSTWRSIAAPEVKAWPAPAMMWARFDAAVRHRSSSPALQQRLAGTWMRWSWAGVGHEAHRLSQGLAAYGVGSGSRIALQGEIGARMLLLVLAARLLGAHTFPMPTDIELPAARREIRALGLRHVIAAGSAAASVWLAAADDLFVFEADDRAGSEPVRQGVIPFRALRAGWGGHGPEACRPARLGTRTSTMWVNETAASGLADAVLSYWLDARACLTFPASRAQADSDRRLARPRALLLSAATLSELDQAIQAGTTKGFLGRYRLRRQLGLDRIDLVEILDATGQPLDAAAVPPETRLRLTSLGVCIGGEAHPDRRSGLPAADPLVLPFGAI
jgi:hypothetical protein